MIATGSLNTPLPAGSPDKSRGEKQAGMAKLHHDKADDFHSLVEQGAMSGLGKSLTDEDISATDCFSAVFLLPMIAAADEVVEQAGDDAVTAAMPTAKDEVATEKMPSAPVIGKVKTGGQAESVASRAATDIPLSGVQKDGGEEKMAKTAQPVQREADSFHMAEKPMGRQGRKVAVDTLFRKGAETVAGKAAGATENSARPSVLPSAAGRQSTGQDFVTLRLNAADMSAPAIAVHPAGKPAQLEVGDKIILKAPTAENTMLVRIEAVEILSNRSHGDMRQLHLKLTPENLGTVEARLRLHESGVSVELRAMRTETAHFLARDHEMLVALLKRSGFKEQLHVSVTISDQTRTVSQRVAPMAQLSGEQSAGQNSSGQHSHSGQDARTGMQGSGQNGRGGNRPGGGEAASRKPYDRQRTGEGDRESHAQRPIRGLVV